MNSSLISIIIPVYNVENYLRQCLDSIISQTYTNYEVIMVDDGSTDSSFDICLEYCIKDERFKAYKKENGGASSARNYGLDKAVGSYVIFIDSDDWIDDDAIRKLIRIAEVEKTDFVISEAVAFDDLSKKENFTKYSFHKKYNPGLPYQMMNEMIVHGEFHIAVWSILFSKQFLDDNRLRFEEGIIYEDLILSYQIYALANKAAHLHETVYHRRFRENSVMTSRKTSRNFFSAAFVFHKVVSFTETLPEERRNCKHIVRCVYLALNDYRALSTKEKRVNRKRYQDLKKSIVYYQAFGDNALKYRCSGYGYWVFFKIIEKLFVGKRADYSIYNGVFSSDKKKVLMLMPHMIGGGAERVAAQLINQMNAQGIDTAFFLSADARGDVIRSDLKNETPLFLLREEMPQEAIISKLNNQVRSVLSSVICKPFELLKKPVPADFAKLSILSQYSREIKYLRGFMQAYPDMRIIAFLQPTIPIVLLAARGLPNRIIISERANPERLMKKRYGKKFIEKYYTRADAIVFQTDDAKAVYPACLADKGSVIPNPLKENLPLPYHGERNKMITTFCRISKQKNLPLLTEAFALLHKEKPDYKLRIIGDAPNDEGIEVLKTLSRLITDYKIEDSVIFETFSPKVHEMILKDAVYVNSSDYEGISNAMLEAMAIGMPVVCTDCPIGGARATITDGENGLLVPMKDVQALCNAMNRVIEEGGLAEKLSDNACQLRTLLSLDMITEKWINLLGE